MKPCRIKMLRTVQQLAFSVHETVLFLDAHPHCKSALAYYAKQSKMLKEAIEAYEKNFGPLTANGVCSDEWTWIKGPWPWEYEANCGCNEEVRRNVAIR